jgi:hypothetical protein
MNLLRALVEDALEVAMLGAFLCGIACLARGWTGL